MDNETRLQLYLAKCGIASRRACEDLIRKGEVSVNGKTVTVMGFKVGPEDRVAYRGRGVKPIKNHTYILLNKPPRYLCTNHDPEGRPLALSLIERSFPERLSSVGRLDFLSSGLVIFTNDGDFTKMIAHPSSQIEKEYLVQAKDPIPDDFLASFQRGVKIEGETYRLKAFRRKTEHAVTLTLVEGKNREIRKVFLWARIQIKKLHRIRIGSVRIGTMEPGFFRPLSVKEIESLKKLAHGGGHDPRD